MIRMKFLISTLLVAGAVAGTAPVALAAAPDPAPGAPGCVGRIVAVTNHASGLAGASGNPNASAGPAKP